VTAERVQVVGMQLEPAAGDHEGARNPARLQPQDAIARADEVFYVLAFHRDGRRYPLRVGTSSGNVTAVTFRGEKQPIPESREKSALLSCGAYVCDRDALWYAR
jgi:hypothetical protein